MELDVTGINEYRQLEEALRSFPDVMRRVAFTDGLVAGARVIARRAKQTEAFEDKTGNLRRSIKARRGQRRYPPSGLVIAEAPHAHIIEHGTVHLPARPFLVPAAEVTRQETARAFVKGIRRRYRRVTDELQGRRKLSRRVARAFDL